MMLDGVSVDARIVRQLAARVERPLREKLERALFFSAEVVALTSSERTEVQTAFERLPWEYEDARDSFLAARSSLA